MADPFADAHADRGYRLCRLSSAEHLRIDLALDGQATDNFAEPRSIAFDRGPFAASFDDQPGSSEPLIARADGSEIRPLQDGTRVGNADGTDHRQDVQEHR